MALKIPSNMYMIAFEQAGAAAVQAETDEGIMLVPIMDVVRECLDDGTGCYARTIAVEALSSTDTDIVAFFTENSLIKTLGQPPIAKNQAIAATGFAAVVDDSSGGTDLTFAVTDAAKNMAAFAPLAMLTYCEASSAPTLGFNPAAQKYPNAMIDYQGSMVVCTAPDACVWTESSTIISWSTVSGCAKKKEGKAGAAQSDWEPCDCAMAACQKGITYVQTNVDGDNSPFGIAMYTVAKSQTVLGNDMTPFDAEVIMNARPQLLKDLITCPDGKIKRVGLVGAVLSDGVAATVDDAFAAVDTPAAGYEGTQTSRTANSVKVAGGNAKIDFKTKVDYIGSSSTTKEEVVNTYVSLGQFYESFGMSSEDAAAAVTSMKAASDADTIGILIAAIQLDAETMSTTDLLSWDPKLSQEKSKNDVVQGKVALSSVSSTTQLSPTTSTPSTTPTDDGKADKKTEDTSTVPSASKTTATVTPSAGALASLQLSGTSTISPLQASILIVGFVMSVQQLM